MPAAAVRQDEALPEELEQLFQEHSRLVYRTAFVITGRRQDAEDVLQSLFVKLLQRGLPPDARPQPARYLHRAAVNLSLNVLRNRRRRRLVDDAELLEIPATQGEENEVARLRDEYEQLTKAMTRLTPRALEILLLYYKHGDSTAQIAERLGTSRSTIAVTLFRIRARLRGLLRPTAGRKGERP
ncbi:MAG: RNA polymerase sigma factor [Vicinamibacterales bacterium]